MKNIVVSILLLLFTLTSPVSAHPGRLDESGGHKDRATGEYHLHQERARPEPRPPVQEQPELDDPTAVEIHPNSLHFVRVERVVDGDTITVIFYNGGKAERVRLICSALIAILTPLLSYYIAHNIL